jgi:hypothetical protein
MEDLNIDVIAVIVSIIVLVGIFSAPWLWVVISRLKKRVSRLEALVEQRLGMPPSTEKSPAKFREPPKPRRPRRLQPSSPSRVPLRLRRNHCRRWPGAGDVRCADTSLPQTQASATPADTHLSLRRQLRAQEGDAGIFGKCRLRPRLLSLRPLPRRPLLLPLGDRHSRSLGLGTSEFASRWPARSGKR